MNRKVIAACLFLLLLLGITFNFQNHINVQAASLNEAKTLILYDADSGRVPDESLMDFTDFPPGAAALTYADGASVLDTSPSGSEAFAGWVSGQAITPEFPILDRTEGFQVNFTLQVESESHERNNRAGFSVILLDQDAKGIELAFWEDEIWAQNDGFTGRLFTPGEGVAFDTTVGFIEYQVSVVGGTYTLAANSKTILSGPVRDYSQFDGFPDPYETPNFLFWGDDTSAAEALVRLRFISVSGTASPLPIEMITATGTSGPLPAATSTPPPTITPVPRPTQAAPGNALELCPSGWLILTVMLAGLVMIKTIGQDRNRP